jgi:Asp-tRNA(Asn)/Glu-tRNA(Gln) amidotransferase A subunit family amidase
LTELGNVRQYRQRWLKTAADLIPDNAEDVHGAPTTVQLIARSYQDEELVAAAAIIDECLRK